MLNKVTHFRFLRYKEKVIIIVLVFLYFPAEVKEENQNINRDYFSKERKPRIYFNFFFFSFTSSSSDHLLQHSQNHHRLLHPHHHRFHRHHYYYYYFPSSF